jgi:uncharacterized membrane protein YfcA
MVILVCLAATIMLAPLAWSKGWNWLALEPALCLVIIAAIDAALGFKLSDTSGFELIVGIICVAEIVYMVLRPRKAFKRKK